MKKKATPVRLTITLGELAKPVEDYCEKHSLKQAELGRLAIAKYIGVEAPKMEPGNPTIGDLRRKKTRGTKRKPKQGINEMSKIAITVDQENNAEIFWDSMQESFPKLTQSLRKNQGAIVTEAIYSQLASLPGFSDGPQHAKNAFLVSDELPDQFEEFEVAE